MTGMRGHLWCLIGLMVVTLALGCDKHRKPTLADRRDFTRRQLTNMATREVGGAASTAYYRTMCQRGLNLLSSKPRLEQPQLLGASFQGHDEYLDLHVTWLEEGFVVKGLVALDESGHPYVFLWGAWSPELRRFHEPTLKRDMGVMVSIGGVPKYDPNKLEPIDLPPHVFEGKVRVALLTEDDRILDPIEAYVDEEIRNLAKPVVPVPTTN
jgi:hypothetical protein